jgi:hypothetical protein
MAFTEEQFKSEFSEKTEELKRKNKELESRLQLYRREHGKLEVFFEEVINSIEPIVMREPILLEGVRKGSPVVPVLHLTDVHMGAVQDSNEIEGFNSYSPEIADLRMTDLTARWLNWVNYQRKAYKIDEAAIIVTGDMISGDIHEELRTTNAFPAPVQVARASELIARFIGEISPYFKYVRVHFISEDNHSRLTKKPQAKEAGMNSLNYLVGYMAKTYLLNLGNVSFDIYPMNEKVINVNERLYLITHGHTIRGWMGVPWYGVERKVGKEALARMQIIMQEFDRAKEIGFHKYVFGHFHTPIDTPLYSCGASLQGTDAYDHQAGRYANPGQSAWLVHPKHGEFNRINFNL